MPELTHTHGTHDQFLVFLSLAIAVFASYTALDLAGRIAASWGRARWVWLAAAALALGGGIWSMHFVAMLAFSLPGIAIQYGLLLTLVSLAVAICVTGIGFLIVATRGSRLPYVLLAGVIAGLGIVSMHYVGMSAMRMNGSLHYIPSFVVLAVVIAVSAATVAFWLAFQSTSLAQRLVASVAMGLAISGMHYTAMAGTMVIPRPAGAAGIGVGIDQPRIAILVAIGAFGILFLALIAALYERKLAVLTEKEAIALRESEARYRALFRNSPLPLLALDSRMLIEQTSDAWLAIIGYDREQVIGQPLDVFMKEDAAARWEREYELLLMRTGTLRDAELRFQKRTGGGVDMLLSAHIERDNDGTFLRVLAGLVDITERRLAEQALRQAQKMEAVGQLAGGIAHDFNNLLTVVIANLESADRAVRTGLFVKAQKNIEAAMGGASRADSLTQRLLAFSRPQPLRPRRVDLNASIAGMVELFRRTLGGSITVETRTDPTLPAVEVDANQLESALLNLVVNARHAMPTGGVVRIITARAAGENGSGHVSVAVADTGVGIPPEILHRVTEPFFTTRETTQGTGLGLSMVSSFVRQSGGELNIESRVGEGTRVTILLPAFPDAADAEPAMPVRASAFRP